MCIGYRLDYISFRSEFVIVVRKKIPLLDISRLDFGLATVKEARARAKVQLLL